MPKAFTTKEDNDRDNMGKAFNNCHNFVVVKFKKPGVIIWAPPDCRKDWSAAGDVLFAVKLTADSSIIPVTVPSFDLRYGFETAWYVRKTCVSRWRDLQNRIQMLQRENERQRARGRNVAAAVEGLPDGDPRKGDDEEQQRDDPEEAAAQAAEGCYIYEGSDGHSQPIKIT